MSRGKTFDFAIIADNSGILANVLKDAYGIYLNWFTDKNAYKEENLYKLLSFIKDILNNQCQA
ncbi:MAG: non-canonical purine NTP pyrophosphatase [Arsenophonus sp. NC-TX2-MAG3]